MQLHICDLLIYMWHAVARACDLLISMWHAVARACDLLIHMWHAVARMCNLLIHMWHTVAHMCSQRRVSASNWLMHVCASCTEVTVTWSLQGPRLLCPLGPRLLCPLASGLAIACIWMHPSPQIVKKPQCRGPSRFERAALPLNRAATTSLSHTHTPTHNNTHTHTHTHTTTWQVVSALFKASQSFFTPENPTQ